MKKFIKLFICLCLGLSITTISSCKKDDTTYDGTLTVATNCEFAPFEYIDVNGDKVGIDMELASEIAKIMNYKLVIKDMAFESVLASIEAKQANIAMAGLTVSAKRLESVDFCTPYFDAQQVVLGKTGSEALSATTIEEMLTILEGKKIGFQNGTVGQYFVEGDEDWEFDGIKNATPMGYTSGAAAIMALKNGQIDYVIIDKVPALQFASKNSDVDVNETVLLTDEKYAFAVQKGDTELAQKVNAALEELKANGKFDEIVEKYYSQN